MLLETLDLRNNDILIYSQNLFNFNDSFKIIHKNAKIKRPKQISYFEVCNHVKNPSPKNLIIYRLLTNVNTLDAFSTKYGYFIKINGKMELIYFDPVFAIKDLRHLRFELDPNYFRFKIQQVGLTSLTKWENEPDFSEVYSFDLKASEAQNQNDKIFADAIFAFDPNFIDGEDEPINQINTGKNSLSRIINEASDNKNQQVIAEDNSSKNISLEMPKAPESERAADLRDEIISLLKQALNIPAEQDKAVKSGSQDFNVAIDDHSAKKEANLFDLFKSTNKSDELNVREKENVILKFEDS